MENVEDDNWIVKVPNFKLRMDSESAPMDTGASGSASGSGASAAGGSGAKKSSNSGSMFTLKKWNAVAMWSWDVECDTCAICRVQGTYEELHTYIDEDMEY